MKYNSHHTRKIWHSLLAFPNIILFYGLWGFCSCPHLARFIKTVTGYILPRVGFSSLDDSERRCFWSSSACHRVSFPFPGTVKEPLLLSLCRVMNAQSSLLCFCNTAEMQGDLTKLLLICPIHKSIATRSVQLRGRRKDLYKTKFLMVILWSKMSSETDHRKSGSL